MRRIGLTFWAALLVITLGALLAGPYAFADGPPPISQAPDSEPVYYPAAGSPSAFSPPSSESASPQSLAAPEGNFPVSYNGGYVQHRPFVHVVFWGSEWNSYPGVKESILNMYRWISGSSYQRILNQYFDHQGPVGAETDLASYTDTHVVRPPEVGQQDVRNEISYALEHQPSWGRGIDSQVVVLTPPGTPAPEYSCAYHFWYAAPWEVTGTYAPFSSPNCRRGLEPKNSMQVTLSHEWAESATDPIPQENYWGWLRSLEGGEIADLCNDGTPAEHVEVASNIFVSKLFDNYLWRATGNFCVVQDAAPVRYSVNAPSAQFPAPHSATLNASINPAGWPGSYQFALTGPSGTAYVPPRNESVQHGFGSVGNEGFGDFGLSATFGGLKGSTVYRAHLSGFSALTEPRIVEEIGVPQIFDSSEVQFTTPAWRPIVSASAVPGKLSASLRATIDGQGSATHYHFEYGLTTNYGNVVPLPDGQVGAGISSVEQLATELEGTYHYRVVATNEEGTTVGPDSTFFVQPRPSVTTEGASAIRGSGGTISGTVTPNGAASTYKFEYGTTTSYGASTPELSAGSGVEPVAVNAVLTGLQFGAPYHYRLVASNWAGTRLGADRVFTPGWADRSADLPPGESPRGILRNVSCASPTMCMAGGATGIDLPLGGLPHTQQWNGTDWTTKAIPIPTGGTRGEVTGVSCPTTTFCEAVGIYRLSASSAPDQGFAEKWNGTSWELQAAPALPGATSGRLEAVSCTTATFCMAVGVGNSSSEPSSWKGITARWNGTKWEAEKRPPVASGYLTDISCQSASSCTVIGKEAGSPYVAGLFSERWNGTSWTAQSMPNPSQSVLGVAVRGLSCPSTSICEVVGDYGASEGRVPFAQKWNGTSWQLQAVENIGASNETQLNGVSCATTTSCEAVGQWLTGKFGDVLRPTAERLREGSWQLQPLPEPYEAGPFKDVSCASPTACVAVGQGENNPITFSKIPFVGMFFATPPPTVVTATPTNLSAEGATLKATVNPNGSTTKYSFEYGRTISYGSISSEVAAGSGFTPVEASQVIGSLEPGVTYHYRVVATNAEGTTRGKDQAFETNAASTAFLLNGLKVTEPFDETASAVSSFNGTATYPANWWQLGWALGSPRKGEDSTSGYRPGELNFTGAYFGPSIPDLGRGTAVIATMATGPARDRYFDLWLNMPSPTSSTRNGYEVEVKKIGPAANIYEVYVNRWAAGARTLMFSKHELFILAGTRLALVAKDGAISLWQDTGSGFSQLGTNKSTTYIGGFAGVGGQGVNAALTKFTAASL